jgi:cob(I)alamin adenosyltransferase
MKIYTKTGDKGSTGLIGGRLPKTDLIFDVLGTNDELSSSIGLACALLSKHDALAKLQGQLFDVQKNIQTINSKIAGKREMAVPRCQVLEEWIDEMDKQLPPLRRFILPVQH